MTGGAVIVCTYDKLFNARTTFDRHDVGITPCAIVLDDAHAGVEEVRQAFTLTCAHDDVVGKLLSVLEGGCRPYASGKWEDLVDGRPDR